MLAFSNNYMYVITVHHWHLPKDRRDRKEKERRRIFGLKTRRV